VAAFKGRYLAYLLRIWQVKDGGELVCRASLEDPHTGERQGFSSLESLIDFLLEQIQQKKDENEPGWDHAGN
jgi:hypothetical protein